MEESGNSIDRLGKVSRSTSSWHNISPVEHFHGRVNKTGLLNNLPDRVTFSSGKERQFISKGESARPVQAQERSTPEALEHLLQGRDSFGSLSRKDLDSIVDLLKRSPSLRQDEMEALGRYSVEVRKIHSALHRRIKEDGPTEELSSSMTIAHLLNTGVYEARNKYWDAEDDKRFAKIQEKVLSGKEASPIYKQYNRDARITEEEMEKVLSFATGLDQGNSPLIIPGNKVKILTREKLWISKVKLLDDAIKNAKGGTPPKEIDAQYYELSNPDIVERLVTAAKSGVPVRTNLDGGRLLKSDNPDRKPDASEIAKKLYQFQLLMDETKGTNTGISLFPTMKLLGDDQILMHRKVLRVGDQVLLPGMNANFGSGENIDAGQLIEGPAARKIAGNFARDVKNSAGATTEEIYGDEALTFIQEGEVTLNPAGLSSFLKLLLKVPMKENLSPEDLVARAADLKDPKTGNKIDLQHLISLDEVEQETDRGRQTTRMSLLQLLKSDENGARVPLTAAGGKLLSQEIDEIVSEVNAPENLKRLSGSVLPDGSVKGLDKVVVTDLPEERQATVLHLINQAEKFIYLPDFVMTPLIATALATRKNELAAQGKNLDVRVVLDPGIYPDGGTPNQGGYSILEDAGIPVKWGLIKRTTPDHQRKLHAKEAITDKGFYSGSTNMSKKGLTQNWEQSSFLYWRADDPESMKQKDAAVADFMKTWNEEAVKVDTKAMADVVLARVKSEDLEERKDEFRYGMTMRSLDDIEAYEKQAAELIQRLASDRQAQFRIQKYRNTGMAEGYATLQGVEETVTREKLESLLKDLPAWKTLHYHITPRNKP